MVRGINERGLNDFCPHTNEEMISRLKMQKDGDVSIYSFNPVMYANTGILVSTIKNHQKELAEMNEVTMFQKFLMQFGAKPKERMICPVCYFYQDNLIDIACDAAQIETARLVKLASKEAPQ
jgi:hypothetical protein